MITGGLLTGLRSQLTKAAAQNQVNLKPASSVPMDSQLQYSSAPGKDTVHFSGGATRAADITNPDFKRWRDILTGKARQDLKEFRSPSNFEKSEDGKSIQVPDETIDLPRFMRGTNEGGQGQGQGEEGDQVGEVGENGEPQPGDGEGKPGKAKAEKGDKKGEKGEEPAEGEEAGDELGNASLDDWNPKISMSEIAQLIGDDLELPNFQPRGKDNIQKIEEVWDSISRVGTPGNVHRRKTFNQIMRREMAVNGKNYNPDTIQWRKDDFRFLNTSEKPIPKENAVIINVIDTSGSMSALRKKMARDVNFYKDAFIKEAYGAMNAEYRGETATVEDYGNGVKEEFIIHSTDARLLATDREGTAEEKFYRESMNGGTKFVPALKEVEKLIAEKYPLDQWNVYVFHYTDGETGGDDKQAAEIIKRLIDQGLNLYGYVQTQGTASSYTKTMNDVFGPRNQFVRRVKLENDSPEECRKGVHALLGKDDVRSKIEEG